jgi:putative tricarboxylic transport membrane protein
MLASNLGKQSSQAIRGRNKRVRIVIRAVAGCALVASVHAGPSPARAADWAPQHNVEFIVPTAAGSTMDVLARSIQKIWSDAHAIAVSMTVEAKAGASGAVAWTYLSRQSGDGHYIAISGPTLLANELLGIGTLKYTEVTPVAQLFTEYTVFAVRTDAPIKTGADLIEAMRSSSTLSIGVAPGFGGSNHVAVVKLARAANIDPNKLAIVPFRGANEAITALLGGQIDMADATISAIEPFLASGKLRAVAVAAPHRLGAPNAAIPTWSEQGLDVVEGNWRGIVAPPNLGPGELAYWGERVAMLVKSPDWAEVLARYHWDEDYSDSAGSKRFLDARYQELRATFANLRMTKEPAK